jgi:pimeloyl-ACP methyl ester carboxylesterase
METKFYDTSQGKISYSINGSGPVILFFHGFPFNKTIWYPYMEKMNEFTTLAIDLPGHGDSDLFSEPDLYQWSQKIYELLIFLSINHVTIIGHSMGGYLACSFAELYPSMIKGLGLFHSSARADTDEKKQNRDRIIKTIEEDHIKYIVNSIPSLFSPDNRIKYNKEIATLIEQSNKMDKQALINAQLAMRDREGHLEMLNTALFPFLFIIGKQDPSVPYETSLAQATLTKVSLILMLENCGHMGFIEEFNKTLVAIKSFATLCNE